MIRADVGLTGGIGCGKSEVARILLRDGIAVLDTDEVAHQLMTPGERTYDDVVEAFGKGVLASNGTIDRKILGSRVFQDPLERELLNRLVHPAVRERWQSWLGTRRAENECAVVVIPLLFETGATREWTAIVCVSARESLARERLKQRGLSREQIDRRIAAQMPLDEKVACADHVIENNGTLEELEHRVRAMWATIVDKE